MLYFVQRAKVRSQAIPIPEGLPELLGDITREVLRCQPTTECLCQFIIDYLHSVMVAREKAKAAKAIIDRALEAVDEIAGDMCICDIPKEKTEEMVSIMESCFKRFLAKRRCEMGREKEPVQFNEVDLLDELIKKCNFSEIELKMSRPVIEAAYEKFVHAYGTAHENTEGTEALYQYFREREEKRRHDRRRSTAATKIQGPEDQEDENDFLLQDSAARKIQHFFRARVSTKRFTSDFIPVEHAADDECETESVVSMTAHSPVNGKAEDKDEEMGAARPADEEGAVGGDA
uniref:RIIa domain-containing protein n=1 Tax=Glossina brevipalpis TaxID=37001 RepID=A0A1A9W8P9_9MUSC